MPSNKNFGPMRNPLEKISDPQNTHDRKFWTHEIPRKAPWQ